MNDGEWRRVRVIDSHTGGEPTRVVVRGGPDLGSGPLAERLERFRQFHDDFRSAVVNEPRGSDAVGELHEPPVVRVGRGGVGAGPGEVPGARAVEDDLKVGGARTNRVRIISPKYEKICIGIDDTDTKTEGATWVTALKCAEACRIEDVEFLNMRLVQLNPAVPQKTTNCVSSALNFAVKPEKIPALLEFVRSFVEKHTVSPDTGIAYYRGIGFSSESSASVSVKTEIMTLAEAESAAQKIGIGFIDGNARKGRIGALGAVLWGNKGIEAAGLYGEHL